MEHRVAVRNYPIRLGQFLKLAAVATEGIEAKQLIKNGEVRVNDAVELRRGRQLRRGDVVAVAGIRYLCG